MLSPGMIEAIFFEALSSGGDFAEVFLEENFTTEFLFQDQRIEKGMSGRDFGIGIRVFQGLNYVYGHTNDLSPENLIQLTRKVTRAFRQKEAGQPVPLGVCSSASSHSFRLNPSTTAFSKKIEWARRAHESGKRYDARIKQMSVNFLDQDQSVVIANTQGLYVEDRRVRTRMLIVATAQQDNVIETGYVGPGALKGLEFYEQIDIEAYARDAARCAVTMVGASYCPAGVMPVVIDNGFGGLMVHEACGHSLEASSVAKGVSVFSGKLGQKVASDLVTLVDDGSIPHAWGSMGVDDEGMKTQKNVLIDKGVLKGYMIDSLNARRMGMAPTASGRRQNYRFAPTSRMSNTFIAPGDSSREEIIASTPKGLFAKSISAGSVNPATGDFNFSLSEAYLIEEGKITEPVKGATLIGNGSDFLIKIDKVAHNLERGQGYCFAGSGALFIEAGQPTLRVSAMTVGGRGER